MDYLRCNRMQGRLLPKRACAPDIERETPCRRSCSGRRLASTARALMAAALLLGSGGHAVLAASGGFYTLDPTVIAGGGATLSGGSFRLSGTVGQAATATLSASGFRLHDGFWPARATSSDTIFANGFEL